MSVPDSKLDRLADDDRAGVDALVLELYDDLRGLAERCLTAERGNHTLQPTALVHEAYMRLSDQRRVEWQGRAHFLGVASRVIRRILVDHARGRNAAKRGGGKTPLTIEHAGVLDAGTEPLDLMALDDALDRLARINEVQAQIVQLRFFGGLGVDEVADVLSVGSRTVDREWAAAKAWLYRAMASDS